MTFPGCSNILLFFFLTLVLVNPSVAQEPHIIPDAPVGDIRPVELNTPGSNMNLFLFGWDDIPGNDTGRFIRILKIGFHIEWIGTAKIEKIDGGKTIKIFTKENSLLLKLNDEKTRVNLTTNDGRTDDFVTTMNNGKLNIYKMFTGNTSIVPKLQTPSVSNNTILNIHKALTFENRVNNINKGTNYSTIQAAIDDASAGDEIYVNSGIYPENVNVTRQLILRGESNLSTIIEGNGSGNVVEVNANGIVIDGFRILNGSIGIYVTSNNCIFSNNVIMEMYGLNGVDNTTYGANGGMGGLSSGIYLSSSVNNTLSGNIFNNIIGGTGGAGGGRDWDFIISGLGGSGGMSSGLYLNSSPNNTIAGNLITNIIGGIGGTVHSVYGTGGSGGLSSGIYLSDSLNNNITGNEIKFLTGGFGGQKQYYPGSGGSGGSSSGIYLTGSMISTIAGNTISNLSGGTGGWGITDGMSGGPGGSGGTSSGLYLSGLKNNMVRGNLISNITGADGIWGLWTGSSGGDSSGMLISVSQNNNFADNIISNITGGAGASGKLDGGSGGHSYGIFLPGSLNNVVSGNIFSYLKGGDSGDASEGWSGSGGNSIGIYLPDSTKSNITANTISDTAGGTGEVCYSYSCNNGSNGFSAGIDLSASDNNMLKGNIANSNGLGIFLNSSNFNNVTGNNISNSTNVGIKIYNTSNNNTFENNTFISNNYGIELDSSSKNTIYNNYFNNTNNFVFTGTIYGNIWNTTIKPGKNIMGGSYIGGNFWANQSCTGFSQTCPDSNSDSICDSTNVLDSNNIDHFPLAYPASINLIRNPGFENGTMDWIFYTSGTGNFTAISPGYKGSKAAMLSFGSSGTNIQLYQSGVILEAKTIYRLSFAAYSTTGHNITTRLYQHVSPYTDYGLEKSFDLGTSWQTFTTEFTSTINTNIVNDGRFQFWLPEFAAAGDTYYIDDIRLEKIGVDYESPAVIRNTPTGTNVPVSTKINVTFNEIMNRTSVQSSFSSIPAITGNFSWSGNNMTYTSGSNLSYNTTYTVTVGTGATDLAGNGLQSPYSWQFSIIPAPATTPPVAVCGPDNLKCENVGAPVQFNGSASYDPDGAIASFFWDFGDGTNVTGAAPKHTYSAYKWNGTDYEPFIANLTVTDDNGLTNSTSQKVVIRMAGDANGDGKVNILDASVIGLKWNGNDACADLNNDGGVNILDASIIGLNWGKIP